MTRAYAQSEPFGTRLYVGRAPRAKRARTRHQRAVDYVLSRMRWAGASELAILVMYNELERSKRICHANMYAVV